MNLLALLFLFSFLLSDLHRYSVCSAQQQLQLKEHNALLHLRRSLGIGWPIKTKPCNWTGVECNSGRVVTLTLAGLRRSRRHPNHIPSVKGIEGLTSLSSFNATGFPFSGPIPAAFTGAASLSVLVLSGCNFTGSIPPAIADLRNLQLLDLSSNSLSGSLPESLAGLSKLRTLKLGQNDLSGSIPDSLWNLPNLTTFDVSKNRLNGSFPDGVSGNGSISCQVFNISGNFYFGVISSSFQSYLQRFNFVDLSDNYFRGNYSRLNASLSINCFSNQDHQRDSAVCEKMSRDSGVSDCRSRSQKYVLAGVVGGSALLVLAMGVLVLCLMKGRVTTATEKKINDCEKNEGVVVVDVKTDVKTEVSREMVAPQPVLSVVLPPSRHVSINLSVVGDSFAYDELVKATSRFSRRNLIKQGHSGNLYHGILEDGRKVVVKRINEQSLRRETFLAELDVFAKGLESSDTRLVPFIGHCLESEKEKFLVYKHMPYGDLSRALHKKPGPEHEGTQSLDWITRMKIAIGIAEALTFLHHECTPPLVHRDIESSSILLDDKYEVRLGSLSEICPQQSGSQETVLSKILRPQIFRQAISGSSTSTCAYDVYCMGKVLLELVTGKLGVSGSNNTATNTWLAQMLDSIETLDKESIKNILDPSLKLDEDHLEEVRAVAIIAKLCLSPKPSKRPPARYVMKALENPLKVMRMQKFSHLSWLRTCSSRRSWHEAFVGSLQRISSELRTMQEDEIVFDTENSQVIRGDPSFSPSAVSREICPEP